MIRCFVVVCYSCAPGCPCRANRPPFAIDAILFLCLPTDLNCHRPLTQQHNKSFCNCLYPCKRRPLIFKWRGSLLGGGETGETHTDQTHTRGNCGKRKDLRKKNTKLGANPLRHSLPFFGLGVKGGAGGASEKFSAYGGGGAKRRRRRTCAKTDQQLNNPNYGVRGRCGQRDPFLWRRAAGRAFLRRAAARQSTPSPSSSSSSSSPSSPSHHAVG